MKKILLLLLLATFGIQAQTLQNPTYGNVKLKNNTTDNSATKVNVQSTDGTINTISKSDLVNVVEVNDVPSLPLVGEVGRIYVVKNVNKIYRWNGTFYQELAVADISGLQAQIDLKAPISSVHNPVTLGTANGLSLATQQLSLGLASSGVTGALSGTDWNTFNNKVGGSGSTNFLTKWSGTNTINASGAWRETSNRLANAADNGSSEFQVTGQIDLKSKNTQGDGGQLGAELLTTGTGDASWTGTSFATGYTHVAGSVTTLTSALAPVINNLYQVAYTVTGRTAGSFTIAFGGATTAGIISSSAVGHKASTTGTLVITPTSDFNGTIILSIKQITAGTASFVFRDNGGTIRSELRILGGGNTANGVGALFNNTTGNYNIANGVVALQNNTTGNYNTAIGVSALLANTTGGYNTAIGLSALGNNTTGIYNTANGANAGRFIANGSTSLTVANNSTFLGANTKALSDNSTNETVVGYNAIGDGNNTVSIGNTSVVSSRLRGRILQGNVVDNSIDSGQFSGNVLATGFKTASGTASQFLKANGSVDSNTYLTSASLPTVDQTIIDGSTNAVSGNAVFDGLALKANLASPSLTGTPTAPTATVGANTTQVATTAFVNGGLATKENAFTKNTAFNKNFGTTAGTVVEGGTLGSNAYTSTAFAPLNGTGANGTWGINISGNSQTSSALGSYNWNPTVKDNADFMFGRNSANEIAIISQLGVRNFLGLGSNAYTSTAYLPLTGGGTLTGIVTAPTATAGTNTTQIATTAFVNGGLATKENTFTKNTAFNKNFGTTAGTVVEGNYPPAKDGTGATGTWGINISGTAVNSTLWNGYDISVAPTDVAPSGILGYYNSGVTFQRSSATALSSFLGLGSNAYTSTAFAPLNGTGANGTWGINISGNASSATNWGGKSVTYGSYNSGLDAILGTNLDTGNVTAFTITGVKSWLGLGSNAYNSTPYLPLSGGTLSGAISGTSATFSSTVTASPATADTHLATLGQVKQTRPYKVYTALVSQTGTNAPTATALENTLGGSVAWSRIGSGVYLGELTGAFVDNKTWSSVSIGGYLSGGVNSVALKRFDNNSVILITNKNTLSSDNILDLASIEIRVYL